MNQEVKSRLESGEMEYQESGVTEKERHHHIGSVTQILTTRTSAHSNNYICRTNTKSSRARWGAHLTNYS